MDVVYPRSYSVFRRDLQSITEGMVEGNPYYDTLLEERKKCKDPDSGLPLNKTTFWYWREGGHFWDNPDVFFDAMPPVLSSRIDDERILYAGTRKEINSIMDQLDDTVVPDRIFEKILAVPIVNSFWLAFFKSASFLDDPEEISIPRIIYATGKMGTIRNYQCDGKFYQEKGFEHVKGRLIQIAKEWDVEIKFIR